MAEAEAVARVRWRPPVGLVKMPRDAMTLKDKVVLITGGKRIGQVVARRVAERGAHVATAYRTPSGEQLVVALGGPPTVGSGSDSESPIPIRAIYLIPLVFALNYILGPSNVSHVGHFGGVLAAWILIRREHGASLLPNVASLRWRLKRWRMRRQLRAVRLEEDQWRRRAREHDDHRIH